VYHLELRQFPHNVNRFNLDRDALMAILAQWIHDRPVELGERRWNPREARITIIEGPELTGADLSMGRGWRSAQRRGRDVTAELMREARAGSGSDVATTAPGGHAPVAGGLAPLLGPDGERLLAAWREIAGRAPGLAPSEALALAERQLRDTRAA
jgi:hypothetical protein